MADSIIFNPGGPVPSAGYIRIRDHILIDAALKSKLEALSTSITLVAREIEHAPGIDLNLPGREIIIVADHYDAKGRTINVSGADAAPGTDGRTGAVGLARRTSIVRAALAPRAPPGPLGRTPDRSGSSSSGSATCASWPTAVRAARAVTGAPVATAVTVVRATLHIDGFRGSTGGDGGAGGNGATGGTGGHIHVEFTAAGVPPSPLLIQVDAGHSGAAGRGGRGGVSGHPLEGPERGPNGHAGQAGARGATGTSRVEPIGATAFWTHSMKQVGAKTAAAWAAYRLLVGVYFYRQFKPGVAGLEDRLRLASTEFDSVLRLQPGNVDAARHNRQIELGHNVLGFPANFDLDPRFDKYLQRFVSFAGFITNFYNQGISLILAGDAKSVAEMQITLDAGRIATEIAYSQEDFAAAKSGIDAANETAKDVESRLSLINDRIKVAAAAKPSEGISIGTVLATVGTVAAAVGSVIAAVPTGGASLFALVPSLTGLAVQLNDIGGHIFEATTAEKDALKAKYEKVGKNVDNVVKGVKAVVNLVEAIKQLTDGKTAGNAEVVDLMRQGVQLVARIARRQAPCRTSGTDGRRKGNSGQGKPGPPDACRYAAREAEEGHEDTHRCRTLGYPRNPAQDRLDPAGVVRGATFGRIYTLKDMSERSRWTPASSIPISRPISTNKDIDTTVIVDAYSRSFLPLLDPLDMQHAFDGYFNSDLQFELVRGLKFKSVEDRSGLDAFRTSRDGYRSLSFLIDFSDLPDDSSKPRSNESASRSSVPPYFALLSAARSSTAVSICHGSVAARGWSRTCPSASPTSVRSSCTSLTICHRQAPVRRAANARRPTICGGAASADNGC